LQPPTAGRWAGTILDNLAAGTGMYFVHSFHAQADRPADVLAVTHYNGLLLTAGVQRDNVTGFQCHPEKSGKTGLLVLSAFLRL